MNKLILIIIFVLSSLQTSLGCRLVERNVISLSGPMTFLLYKLDLLSDKNLIAISSFNQISKKEFKGRMLKGGMFLSKKTLSNYKKPYIIFDENSEQRKILEKLNVSKKFEIKTRSKSPYFIYNYSKQFLKTISSGCEEKMALLDKDIDKIRAKLIIKKRKLNVLFYLGRVKKMKKPSLLIVNDGFVSLLGKYKKINTYESSLAFVNWSKKIRRKFININSPFEIGVTGKKLKKAKLNRVYTKTYNFDWRFNLIPGLAQFYAAEKFLDLLKVNEGKM